MIQCAKKSFFAQTISDNHGRNPKLLWKNLKDLSGNTSKSQTNFISDDFGNPITDPEITRAVTNTPRGEYDTYHEYRVTNTNNYS